MRIGEKRKKDLIEKSRISNFGLKEFSGRVSKGIFSGLKDGFRRWF